MALLALACSPDTPKGSIEASGFFGYKEKIKNKDNCQIPETPRKLNIFWSDFQPVLSPLGGSGSAFQGFLLP